MNQAYKYTTLPKIWPGTKRPAGFRREAGKFKLTTWKRVEDALFRELRHLGAKDVVIAIDLPNPGHWNLQGAPRAEARANTPAVIVSFTRRDGVRMTFPCDTFSHWQTNVYAIAKSLENLRAVDRYGVTLQGQQYAGFAALPPAGGTAAQFTAEQAADIIAEFSELPAHVIISEPSVARLAIQRAKNATHPDKGAAAGDFDRVTKAAEALESAQ